MILFVKDPAPTEIYTYRHTLTLHDALPILDDMAVAIVQPGCDPAAAPGDHLAGIPGEPGKPRARPHPGDAAPGHGQRCILDRSIRRAARDHGREIGRAHV